MQEVDARQNKIKCSQHFYKNATFFQFNIEKNEAQAVCQYCALSNKEESKKLLFIEEIYSDDPYTMIANWPPLNKQGLVDKFAEICDEIYINSFHSKTRVESIIEYFQNIREQFTQKIHQIEKKMLTIASEIQIEDLMKVYNEVIEKEKLREIIRNYSSNQDEELQKLIKNAKVKIEENSAKIEGVINHYEIYKRKLNLDQFSLFFEGIYKSLDNFFNCESMKIDSKKMFIDQIMQDRLLQHLKTVDNSQLTQIVSLNTNYDNYIQDIHTNLQRGQKQKLIDSQMLIIQSLNQILKQHIDVIQMPLSDRIKAKLHQKQIQSNQSEARIEGYKISQMGGYNFSYIDVQITQEHIGESFTIKINNLQQWIGIGIIERNQILQKNYKFTGLYNDKFCYVISQNGYSWSLLSEIQNKKKISFNFKSNDVIKITIEYGSIIFENTTINDTFQMDFSFEEGKYYCPGFCLYNQYDQIEFL